MKRSNSQFYGALAVMITIASFLFCWKFTLPSYRTSQQAIAQTEEETDQAKAKLESLKVAQKSIASLGDTVDNVLLSVPKDKDTPNLITELEALAAQYKLLLPSINISDASSAVAGNATALGTTNSSDAVSVTFGSVESDFTNIHNFIASLEKDVRFMNIEETTITNNPETGKLSLSVKIKAFKSPDTSISSLVQSLGGGQ